MRLVGIGGLDVGVHKFGSNTSNKVRTVACVGGSTHIFRKEVKNLVTVVFTF